MNKTLPSRKGRRFDQRATTIAVMASLSPALAFTQEIQPSPVLEEIVVTAGFRESDLMSTPVSVTVIDESIIEARAAQHLEAVLNTAANVSYSSGGSRARFVQVRGVGDLEQFVDPKHFPSVGVTIDGLEIGTTATGASLGPPSRR